MFLETKKLSGAKAGIEPTTLDNESRMLPGYTTSP